MTNIFAVLNSDRYPIVDTNYNFTKHFIAKAYRAATEFKKDYYGTSNVDTSLSIPLCDYKALYPLFVIDVRHQSEKLKNSVQDIVLKVTFAENVAADTTAYALLISDRLLYLQSDGNKFQMMY